MKAHTLTHPALSRRRLLAGAAASATLGLLGCGSGDGDGLAGVDSGGTGSFSTGPIRGFGSILVNDVHYEEIGARIIGDAGQALAPADLRLGMIVDIDGEEISTSATGRRSARASAIGVRSEIEGPVTAVDIAGSTFTVLGQVVQVNAGTVFDDDLRGGLARLHVGQAVEVYGFLQQGGHYVATRIDDEDDPLQRYKLRGPVSALDEHALTFRIGGTLVSYAGLGPASMLGLADGQFTRVELQTSPEGSGAWPASRIQAAAIVGAAGGREGVKAEIEGYITRFDSATRFSVAGIEVDASNASRLPAALGPGVRVEVEGRLANGVLTAHEVELEHDDDDDEFEIEGVIDSVSHATRTFVIRGITVDYSRARFDDGTAADLAPGVKVEVEGELAADGITMIATEIDFDD